MYQKLSSFHLTHPTLIISYFYVIVLIICNFLYPLGFIGSFYVLFFSSSYFLFFYFILFFCFIFPPFLSILFFLFYPLFFHFLLSFLSSIFLHIVIYYFSLFFFFSYSLLRWQCHSYYHTRISLSFFYFDFLSFFIFSFLYLFSTFYTTYTFHIICAISIMYSNSFSLSIDRLTWTSNYLTVLYYERIALY